MGTKQLKVYRTVFVLTELAEDRWYCETFREGIGGLGERIALGSREANTPEDALAAARRLDENRHALWVEDVFTPPALNGKDDHT